MYRPGHVDVDLPPRYPPRLDPHLSQLTPPASNMSGMSTTQSAIADDLESYDNAMWFTSSYLISQASVAPLLGRLAMIFSPGAMIMFTSFFFSVGAVVTSQAQSFRPFIIGRILSGIGGGGVMTLAMILVIQLASKRRRGLIIGLTNAVCGPTSILFIC